MTKQAVKSESKDADKTRSRAKARNNHPEKFVMSTEVASLVLQRKADCACGGDCPPCQAKSANLPVSHPTDAAEIEADEIADKVMRKEMIEPAESSQFKEGEKLHRKKNGGSNSSAPRIVQDVLSSGGKPLEANAREFMESRFNRDFGNVKIHDNDLAAKSASSINALAYTAGSDIVFNSGQYDPNSESGKRLLAHELAHVAQQEKTSKSIQRKPTLVENDYEQIINQVHDAIYRVGTDEEAVYSALQRLERDGDAIRKADKAYSDKFKPATLEEDIRGDFEDEELQYALELIGIGPPVVAELIQSAPSSDSDYESYAKKLYAAMDIWGTNEEAIYGVLIAMENVPERIEKLKKAYTDKYPTGVHGGDLESDIRNEMSDEELDYALLLLNVVPQGNTAILNWIRGLIANPVNKETAAEIMKSLDKITSDRLTVIIVDLMKGGELALFKSNLVSAVADDFKALAGRIDSVEAKFKDPGLGTTAAPSPGQKKQIKGILNQGMKLNEKGEIGDFEDVVDGRSYQQDIEDTLEKVVASLTKRAEERDKYKKFGWSRYDEMANEAKARTDALFGHFAAGPVLSSTPGADRNLFDVSEQTYNNADLDEFANYLVTAHKSEDPVYPDKTIHQAHTADVERDKEKKKIDDAFKVWFGKTGNKDRILLLMRTWKGTQGRGNIFLQRWDLGDEKQNRAQFWKTFHTMIHEYLHKITNPEYSKKAEALGRVKEQVYTEGGTSYFDERVWKTLYPEEVRANPKLREKVEGGVYDFDSSLIPEDSAYDQIDPFKEIVKIVGEENAAAAYFLGKTDLIGL